MLKAAADLSAVKSALRILSYLEPSASVRFICGIELHSCRLYCRRLVQRFTLSGVVRQHHPVTLTLFCFQWSRAKTDETATIATRRTKPSSGRSNIGVCIRGQKGREIRRVGAPQTAVLRWRLTPIGWLMFRWVIGFFIWHILIFRNL